MGQIIQHSQGQSSWRLKRKTEAKKAQLHITEPLKNQNNKTSQLKLEPKTTFQK